MKFSTHNKGNLIFHIVLIILLSLSEVIALTSFIYALNKINVFEDIVSEIINFLFALLILFVLYFEIRSLCAYIYLDEEGIKVKRFNRTKVYLKWNEIQDIGICNIPTPFGYTKRVYLSNNILTEDDKIDMVTIKYNTVHFSYMPKEVYDFISKKVSLDVPKEVKEFLNK